MNMHINYYNKSEFNKINSHDSEFTGYLYDYDKRQIKIWFNNHFLKKILYFEFNNVIFCEMQSCYFWGGGNSIYTISLVENPEQFNRLIKIQNSNPDLYKRSYLDKGICYITIKLEINSGDVLLIICENVDYHEDDLKV